MSSFDSVVEAYGLMYRAKISVLLKNSSHTSLPDDGRSISRISAEKHYDQDMMNSENSTHNCVGTEKFQGDAAGGSKLIEQTAFRPFLSWL